MNLVAAQECPDSGPRARLAAAPWRTGIFLALAGVLAGALLVAGLDDNRAPRRDAAVAGATGAVLPSERLSRGAVHLSPGALPVPLPQPAPRLAQPPAPVPAAVDRVDTGSRAAPRGDVWWPRAPRSSRPSAPTGELIPADASIRQ